MRQSSVGGRLAVLRRDDLKYHITIHMRRSSVGGRLTARALSRRDMAFRLLDVSYKIQCVFWFFPNRFVTFSREHVSHRCVALNRFLCMPSKETGLHQQNYSNDWPETFYDVIHPPFLIVSKMLKTCFVCERNSENKTNEQHLHFPSRRRSPLAHVHLGPIMGAAF